MVMLSVMWLLLMVIIWWIFVFVLSGFCGL